MWFDRYLKTEVHLRVVREPDTFKNAPMMSSTLYK